MNDALTIFDRWWLDGQWRHWDERAAMKPIERTRCEMNAIKELADRYETALRDAHQRGVREERERAAKLADAQGCGWPGCLECVGNVIAAAIREESAS